MDFSWDILHLIVLAMSSIESPFYKLPYLEKEIYFFVSYRIKKKGSCLIKQENIIEG